VSYLNFESIIVMTISDTNLYEEPIPDIILDLLPSDFKYKKNLNKIENMKFDKRKNHINNENFIINKFLREFKTIFDCKMKKNGSFEDCYNVSHQTIEILNRNISKSKVIRDSLKENINYLNESVIRNLKIFKRNHILLKFS